MEPADCLDVETERKIPIPARNRTPIAQDVINHFPATNSVLQRSSALSMPPVRFSITCPLFWRNIYVHFSSYSLLILVDRVNIGHDCFALKILYTLYFTTILTFHAIIPSTLARAVTLPNWNREEYVLSLCQDIENFDFGFPQLFIVFHSFSCQILGK